MSCTVPDPRKRPSTAPLCGSTMRNVGQASSGYFSTTALLASRSVSTELHTKASATGFNPGSLSTNRCMERQEWHQVAQKSTKSGLCWARAVATAFWWSSSMKFSDPCAAATRIRAGSIRALCSPWRDESNGKPNSGTRYDELRKVSPNLLRLLRGLLRFPSGLRHVVGAHDFLHQRVADHVAVGELAEADALDVLEDLHGVHHSGG